MDSEEFREKGAKMVDFIVDYFNTLPERRVRPNVKKGYLKEVMSSTPPKNGESIEKIMDDVKNYILPGLTHWQHPGFHAFFPSCSTFASIMGNMLADMFGFVNFNWDVSPCGSELELITVQWFGKMIGLPNDFLQRGPNSRGSGVVQRSTSECIFICMVTARRFTIRRLTQENPTLCPAALLSSLVVYCSKEAHNCIEKIGLIAMINVKILDTEKDFTLSGKTVRAAILEDKKIGLIPFFVNITVGTESCASCDPIEEIGLVCKEHNIWLHVDATYAGNAMVCPEFRHYFRGIEYASSLNVNPCQGMLTHVDCCVMFVKDKFKVKDTVIVDKTIFGYSFSENDWGYPSKTEFQALKIYFVLRNYGIEGIQSYIRNYIRLAEIFESYVRSDDRFEFIIRNFGIVCFRLKGSDEINKVLQSVINTSGKLFTTPCRLSNKCVIRFSVGNERASEDDIKNSWSLICDLAKEILEDTPELLHRPSDIFDYTYRYGLP